MFVLCPTMSPVWTTMKNTMKKFNACLSLAGTCHIRYMFDICQTQITDAGKRAPASRPKHNRIQEIPVPSFIITHFCF